MTNSKNTKKIVSGVVLAILLGAIIFGVVWLVKNWSAISSGTQLYTHEQYLEYGKQEYDRGLGENEDYKATLVMLEEYDQLVLKLTTQLDNAEARVLELETKDEQNTQRLQVFKNQVNEISQQLQEVKQKRDELQMTLNAYEKYEGQLFEIKFYSKNSIHHVELVKINNTLDLTTIPTPNIEYGTFLGWSLDNETITSETSFVINQNMTFYAKFDISSLQETLDNNNLAIVDTSENIGVVGDYIRKQIFHSKEIMKQKIDNLDVAENLKLVIDTGKEVVVLDCSNLTKDTYTVKHKTGSGMSAVTETYTGYSYSAEFVNDSYNFTLTYDYLPDVNGNEVEISSSLGTTMNRSCNYLTITATNFSVADNVNIYLTKNKNFV